MAYGSEVHFGFPYSEFPRASEALGVEVDLDESYFNEAPGGGYDHVAEINNKLESAYKNALLEAGFTILHEYQSGHFMVETPEGKREMACFKLEVSYDPHEMGQEPEDATLGVALSGRYFPTFIDFKNEHGTLNGVAVDGDLTEIAKKHIAEALPAFKDAKVYVVDRHY